MTGINQHHNPLFLSFYFFMNQFTKTCTNEIEFLMFFSTRIFPYSELFLFMLTMNVIHELCTMIYRLLNILFRLVSGMNSKPKNSLWDLQTTMGMKRPLRMKRLFGQRINWAFEDFYFFLWDGCIQLDDNRQPRLILIKQRDLRGYIEKRWTEKKEGMGWMLSWYWL